MDEAEAIAGYYAAVHRALTEPILLGGAPRAVAIVNGTLAAAIGLGLRLWIWAAKRDPAFVEVVRRHLRYPPHMAA
jgi:type IV secretory pathway TrbD component